MQPHLLSIPQPVLSNSTHTCLVPWNHSWKHWINSFSLDPFKVTVHQPNKICLGNTNINFCPGSLCFRILLNLLHVYKQPQFRSVFSFNVISLVPLQPMQLLVWISFRSGLMSRSWRSHHYIPLHFLSTWFLPGQAASCPSVCAKDSMERASTSSDSLSAWPQGCFNS